jgi:coenzyme F420-0:L-glutamate ligase/coenzyme F420-1:gamma-L-glutamate ligase
LILEGLDEAGLRLEPGDVVALAQKIVSKAEGRLVALKDVSPSPEADRLALVTEKDPRLVELILRESRQVLRSRPGLLIVEHRLGFVCANAGVDQSNVAGGRGSTEEMALLLPIDPDSSAAAIRRELERASRARIGVVIIDSHGRPWREGAIGVAIGIAGMPGVLDLRGQPDLFGDPLQVTTLGLADEVAAAASLLMGQSDEGRPVVHLRGLPYPLREGSMREIIRPEEKDLFR